MRRKLYFYTKCGMLMPRAHLLAEAQRVVRRQRLQAGGAKIVAAEDTLHVWCGEWRVERKGKDAWCSACVVRGGRLEEARRGEMEEGEKRRRGKVKEGEEEER